MSTDQILTLYSWASYFSFAMIGIFTLAYSPAVNLNFMLGRHWIFRNIGAMVTLALLLTPYINIIPAMVLFYTSVNDRSR